MARMASWDDVKHSAERGDGVAAFELAMGHASGSGGLAVDLVRAHCWFNVASARGYREGQAWRQEISAEMTGPQISEAQRMARTALRAMA